MAIFHEISPEELRDNPFHLFDKEWTLITAEHAGKVNMLTASWGGLGIMWHKPVAYIAIRPQRFTKTLVDAEEHLSLCFFDESYRKELAFCGRNSGKDVDKIAECHFTVAHENQVPYFDEARMVLVCRKLFAQPYDKESFLDKSILTKDYAAEDYHTFYIVEIEKILVK